MIELWANSAEGTENEYDRFSFHNFFPYYVIVIAAQAVVEAQIGCSAILNLARRGVASRVYTKVDTRLFLSFHTHLLPADHAGRGRFRRFAIVARRCN